MTERPIIFDGESVRAILAGRKTQTRRVVTPQPEHFSEYPHWRWRHKTGLIAYDSGDRPGPYGKYVPGDRLWIREKYSVAPTPGCSFGEAMRGAKLTVTYCAGGDKHLSGGTIVGPGLRMDYGAADYNEDFYGIVRSPMFMPRWASRPTVLEVVAVRVERLHDISDADVVAEGIPIDVSPPHDGTRLNATGRQLVYRARWDAINGKRAPWASNPWVWVVEFRRVE